MKICLLTIDCLRYDTLNQEVMPFLSEKKEQGLFLTNYYSNAPFTPTAFPTIFTGKYPLENELVLPINREDSFVTDLKQNGFKTVGISNNPYLGEYFNFDAGFDRFENLSMGREVVGNIVSRKIKRNKLTSFLKKNLPFLSSRDSLQPTYGTADQVSGRVLSQLEKRQSEENLFLWAHLMDLHDPYISKEEFRAEFDVNYSSDKIRQLNQIVAKYRMNPEKLEEIKPEKIDDLRNLYRSSAKFIDHQIRKIWNEADQDTIFIITADHGEEFKEHDNLGHLSKLYHELLHVPFLIAGPGLDKLEVENERNDDLHSSLDLLPTILDLAEIKPKRKREGTSILSQKGKDYVISESIHNQKRLPPHHLIYRGKKSKNDLRTYSYFNGRYKLIIDKQTGNQLFDLKHDPQEKENIIENLSEKPIDSSILEKHIVQQMDQIDLEQEKI